MSTTPLPCTHHHHTKSATIFPFHISTPKARTQGRHSDSDIDHPRSTPNCSRTTRGFGRKSLDVVGFWNIKVKEDEVARDLVKRRNVADDETEVASVEDGVSYTGYVEGGDVIVLRPSAKIAPMLLGVRGSVVGAAGHGEVAKNGEQYVRRLIGG